MNHLQNRFWQTPNRLSPAWAKIVAGLAIFILVIAASGLVLYEGITRVVHVSALALVGLTNLAWALGSLLPEAQGAKTARDAVRPLSIPMLVALAASVWMRGDGVALGTLLVGVLAAVGVLVAMRLTKRM